MAAVTVWFSPAIFVVPTRLRLLIAPTAAQPAAAVDQKGQASRLLEVLKIGQTAKDVEFQPLKGAEKTKLSELTKDGPVVLVVLRGYPGYQCPICTRQVADLRSKADDFDKLGAKVVLVYPGPGPAESLKKLANEFLGDKDLPKPFFSPVRSAGGTIITRPLEKPEDHPHHKGIWLSIDEVNDIGFWAEKGKIENVSAEPVVAEGNPATLKVVNHWQGSDGKPVLVETTTISIFPNRLMVYDIQLTAGSGPVTFGDTKEGSFGVRINDQIRADKKGKGKLTNAEGKVGEKECWGHISAWCDYSGPIDGKQVGLAILADPKNPHPSAWHARGYGLMAANPFGRGKSGFPSMKGRTDLVTLKKGEHLVFRYGLLLHEGDAVSGQVAEHYQRFVDLRVKE